MLHTIFQEIDNIEKFHNQLSNEQNEKWKNKMNYSIIKINEKYNKAIKSHMNRNDYIDQDDYISNELYSLSCIEYILYLKNKQQKIITELIEHYSLIIKNFNEQLVKVKNQYYTKYRQHYNVINICKIIFQPSLNENCQSIIKHIKNYYKKINKLILQTNNNDKYRKCHFFHNNINLHCTMCLQKINK